MSITIRLEAHKNPRIDALTPAERLRWILGFMQRDLEALPSKELEALGDDLLHATAPWWVEKKRQCTDMSADQVRALQQEIRDGVQAAMGTSINEIEIARIHWGHAHPHGGWVLPQAATHLLRLRFRVRDYVGIMCVSESTNDRTAILTGVANLLITCGDRLSTCPVCGTLFLRQYRQEYCNVRCSNKVRNRRRKSRQTHQKNGQLVTTLN
jgi:hypothetical protein